MPRENDGNVYCRLCRWKRVGWAATAVGQSQVIRAHYAALHPTEVNDA